MIKALLKKQLLESFSWLYFKQKTGTRRSKGGIAVFACLYLLVFAVFGFGVYVMTDQLCAPLCRLGYGWAYIALMSLIALVMGVFGSVFSTYSTVYTPKDNDLLFSLPIPARTILLMRLTGVYLMGLLFELTVMIPTLITWFTHGGVAPLGIVFSLLIPFLLSFFVLTLSCLLGWVVALVASKLRNKTVVTMALSLIFVALYYYFYYNASSILSSLLSAPLALARNMQAIYPLHQLGLAAAGDPLAMLIFTAMTAAIVFAVYALLSHGLLRLATTNKGGPKTKAKPTRTKAMRTRTRSVDHALFLKELRRFTRSANYMLNCGFGLLFLLIAAGALLFNGSTMQLVALTLNRQNPDSAALLIAGLLCLLLSTINITAPSVSLEGKNLWILQTLPASTWQVLKAKLTLHLLLTSVPAAILTACALIVCRIAIVPSFLVAVSVLAFLCMTAMFGLFLNLMSVNLTWTNEAVPVKQSMSVGVSQFGSMGVVVLLGVLCYATHDFVPPLAFLGLADAVLLVIDAVLYRWLKTNGCRRFEAL